MSKSKMILFFIFVIVSFIAACSKDTSTNIKPDSVIYELELSPLKQSDLQKIPNSNQALQFISAINSGKEISFEKVSQFFIQKQVEKFEPIYRKESKYYVSDLFFKNHMPQEHFQFLQSLFSPLKNKHFFELKNSYENQLEKKNGKTLDLNYKSQFTPSIQYNTSMHVQSAAHINMLASRMSRSGLDYNKENYVMVFLNGFMKQGRFLKIGDQWVLYTVDATSTGDAIERVGVASDLQGCLRVVDADYYALASSLMDYLKPNSRLDLVSQIEEMTSEKYGIDLDIQDLDSCERPSEFPLGPNVLAVNETDLLPKYFSVGYIAYKKSNENRRSVGMSLSRANALIQSENASYLLSKKCYEDKKACSRFPSPGTAEARFYIRNSTSEILDIPYIFEAKRDEKMLFAPTRAYAILVEKGFGNTIYNVRSLQCEILQKILDLSKKGTNVSLFQGSHYEFLELNLKYGESHISAGNFSVPLNGSNGWWDWYSTSLSGNFSISDLDVLTFDARQKQKIMNQDEVVESYIQGSSPLLTKEKIKRLSSECGIKASL